MSSNNRNFNESVKVEDSLDTREKLEFDVNKKIAYSTSTLLYPPSANKVTHHVTATVEEILEWFDRLEAIVKREYEMSTYDNDLQEQIDELESEISVLEGKAQAAESMLLYLLEGGEPDWSMWFHDHDGLCDYFKENFVATIPEFQLSLQKLKNDMVKLSLQKLRDDIDTLMPLLNNCEKIQ